ncbi:hypothetical protein, partial [Streptomyces sp. MK37H]|uniref:hypothetical protein n=1 Tax=Streptomyces sp. MK37H TaxID=2699117 RepID=UPI001B36A512
GGGPSGGEGGAVATTPAGFTVISVLLSGGCAVRKGVVADSVGRGPPLSVVVISVIVKIIRRNFYEILWVRFMSSVCRGNFFEMH